MTNIKKIGLTALAGSMVAFSAQAAEMTISGSAKLTYTAKDGTVDAVETGNRFAMDKGMAAKASTELDNGFGVKLYHGFSGEDANESTSSITVDMGAIGTLAYVQADLSTGIESIDDVMPTADEEPSNGLGTTADPLASAHSGFATGFGYTNTVGMLSISAAFSPNSSSDVSDQGGSEGAGGSDGSTSLAVTMSPIEGLTLYAGTGTRGQLDSKNHDLDIYAVKYAFGPLTVGYQQNELDDEDSAGSDYEAEFMAVSFAVNDNLSVSYGRQDTELSGDIDEQEVTGFSVGYSMGGMTVTAHNNESDNHNNVLNATSEHTEISLTFAF